MKINKKIISFVLWIIGLSMLLFSLAFASAKQKKVEIQNLSITVANTEVNDFIDEDDTELFIEDENEN